MNFLNKHNLKAASIHLAISAAIALLCMALVYGLWYPAPLAAALGVGSIFLMLLGIDLVLGPLMTLVVYKPEKSSLKFDLTVIACVQLAALLYGMYTVGSGRPAYMVFTKDRFNLVQAHEVARTTGKGETATLEFESAWQQPLFGYELASATIPSSEGNERILNLITSYAMNGGPDVPNVTQFRSAYSDAIPKIKAKALALSTLHTNDPTTKLRISALQTKYPSTSIVAPLKIKSTIYTVVMQANDATILGIEPVDVF